MVVCGSQLYVVDSLCNFVPQFTALPYDAALVPPLFILFFSRLFPFKRFFFCSYSLTLVDALDTLAVMGNYSEFQRVADLLTRTLNFDKDINVSVFETNIRGM